MPQGIRRGCEQRPGKRGCHSEILERCIQQSAVAREADTTVGLSGDTSVNATIVDATFVLPTCDMLVVHDVSTRAGCANYHEKNDEMNE